MPPLYADAQRAAAQGKRGEAVGRRDATSDTWMPSTSPPAGSGSAAVAPRARATAAGAAAAGVRESASSMSRVPTLSTENTCKPVQSTRPASTGSLSGTSPHSAGRG